MSGSGEGKRPSFTLEHILGNHSACFWCLGHSVYVAKNLMNGQEACRALEMKVPNPCGPCGVLNESGGLLVKVFFNFMEFGGIIGESVL